MRPQAFPPTMHMCAHTHTPECPPLSVVHSTMVPHLLYCGCQSYYRKIELLDASNSAASSWHCLHSVPLLPVPPGPWYSEHFPLRITTGALLHSQCLHGLYHFQLHSSVAHSELKDRDCVTHHWSLMGGGHRKCSIDSC